MKRKFNFKQLALSTALCLLPILMGLFVYQDLPDSVVVHWGVDNQPDGWAPRAVAVFLLPMLMAVINAVFHLGLYLDSGRLCSAKALRAFCQWFVPALGLIMAPITLLSALNKLDGNEAVPLVCQLIVGLAMVVVGNYLPKSRPNFLVGIRLPWTIKSEENWKKTHHLAGFLWVIFGILFLVFAFMRLPWVAILLLALAAVIPCVYSFLLWKKERRGRRNPSDY